MIERSSNDGRVRLDTVVPDEKWLAALVAHGLLEDRPAETVRGAQPTGFGGRGRSVRLVVGDATLIVKRLRRGGVLGRLLGARLGVQFGGPRRLLDAVSLAARLLECGVNTTRPAFTRVRRGLLPGLRELELATFEISGAQDAASFLAGPAPLRARRAAIRACGSAVHALHEAGVRHADLNLGNLLVAPADGRAYVIDLERSTRPDPLTPRDRVANLARLLRSTEKLGLLGTRVSRSDLLRFLTAYEKGARRELFAAVLRLHRGSVRWHRLAWRLFR